MLPSVFWNISIQKKHSENDIRVKMEGHNTFEHNF